MKHCGLSLLLACLLLGPAGGARLLEQQQSTESNDPFSNVVVPADTKVYQDFQKAPNDTLRVIQVDSVVRLSGQRFVPFTLEDQKIIVEAFRLNMLALGPTVLASYKEVQPDPSAPAGLRDAAPSVEFAFSVKWVVNRTRSGQLDTDLTVAGAGSQAYSTFTQWALTCVMMLGDGAGLPKLLTVYLNPAVFRGGFVLHPLVPLKAVLGVTLAGGSGGVFEAEQASSVAQALRQAVLGGGGKLSVGTLVEVVNSTAWPRPGPAQGGEGRLLELEVTMYACQDNATVPSPECERQVLSAVLEQLMQSQEAKQQWQATGIQGVEVLSIAQRQPPEPRPNTTALAPAKDWVPWHLDRIDQRALPLDGKYAAPSTGLGVNVYIISSGVKAEHVEFKYSDGRPGTRVKPGFAFGGLEALKDCADGHIWYGYGTYAASVCCGLRLGPAKDATIYSVRFRESCMSDPGIWAAGGLPSALDYVISTAVRPAVVLLDTWWSAGRSPNATALDNKRELVERLDKLYRAGIPTVAAAGVGLGVDISDPCENVIGSHPGVISVAASDTRDQAVDFGPRSSPCIDIFAPSGGVGTGMWGADGAKDNASYTRVITRAFGAAALVAGVVAQHLQVHPQDGPDDVRRHLLETATPHAVTMAGPNTTTSLLNAEPAAVQPLPPSQPVPAHVGANPSSSGGSALSTGAVLGIVVAAVVVAAAALAGCFAVMRRRRRRRALNLSRVPTQLKDRSAGWGIDPGEIEICRRPDGSEWVLGEGRYGRVYKALKGGVQVVAVKKLHNLDDHITERFMQEWELWRHVSRDANVAQFYGACMHGGEMMLVSEYLEGGDLRSALSGSRGADWLWRRRGKEVILDVVRGVHFLHCNAVVHRDIKSKNILLARDGRAKLADVGLARLLHKGGKSSRSSSDGSEPLAPASFAGTLAWAAPEAFLGEPCTEKADVFSLGVVIWEAVTGEVPQRGNMRDPQPRECSQAVAGAIRACMEPNPDQRPTAKELYDLLMASPGMESTQYTPPAAERASQGDNAGSSSSSSTEGGGNRGSPPDGPSKELGKGCKALSPLSSQLSPISILGGPVGSKDLANVAIDFSKIDFVKNEDGSLVPLGEGAFGKVYKVMLDGVQPLAAKIVDLGTDPSIQEAFFREAAILWRLRHRNVVSLSGVAVADGKGYLLMELMERGSLFKMLNARSRTSNQRLFGWYNRGRKVALDIAQGLHYLHQLRVSHFDIKAGNVLLTEELEAKLADVGLARVMSCSHHSLGGETLRGTLPYMAPEIIAATKCTHAADIFSMGVLLGEICTGNHPVRGRMLDLQVPHECPQDVADLIAACTASDPAARPTARQLVEQLTALQGIKAPTPLDNELSDTPSQGSASKSTAVGSRSPPKAVLTWLKQAGAPPSASPFQAMQPAAPSPWAQPPPAASSFKVQVPKQQPFVSPFANLG